MKKVLIILLILLLTNLYAQDDSFFFEDEYIEDADTGSSMPFTSTGKFNSGTYYIDETFSAYGKLNFNGLFEFSTIDINMDLRANVSGIDNISNFPMQNKLTSGSAYFDSLYLRFYHDFFDLEAGLIKPVWGNADGIHVVDFLNPIDYSDPFGPSYLDKKISQQMVKINMPFGESSLLELVYLPKFDGDYTELNGTWTPYYIKNMETTIYNMLYPMAVMENPMVPEVMLKEQVKANSKVLANSLELEESEYFIDSQVAARFTTTINSLDLGFSYFYGYLKQPTIDPVEVLQTGKLELIYNKFHGFGLDVAAQAGLFNIKGETAYYLTDDIEGDDPSVINNSVNYIVGFDLNLPINNLNLLLQGVGQTVINNSEITKLDPEYKDEYNDFMLMGRLSDNYINESLIVEFSGAYDLIHNDYMVSPLIQYKFTDNFSLITNYSHYAGEEHTDFGQFSENNNLKIEFEYFF